MMGGKDEGDRWRKLNEFSSKKFIFEARFSFTRFTVGVRGFFFSPILETSVSFTSLIFWIETHARNLFTVTQKQREDAIPTTAKPYVQHSRKLGNDSNQLETGGNSRNKVLSFASIRKLEMVHPRKGRDAYYIAQLQKQLFVYFFHQCNVGSKRARDYRSRMSIRYSLDVSIRCTFDT